MTTPTSATPSSATSPSAFVICSGIVGTALTNAVALVGVRLCGGTDADVSTLALMAFLAALFGGFLGLALGARVRERNEALATSLAPAIYLLTVLAVPFLLYLTAVLMFMLAFQSYQF